MGSASAFNQDLSKWDVSSVREKRSMLYYVDLSFASNMNGMFDNAQSFNQDLSNWDVSHVTDMCYVFSHALAFNQDLSKWDVSSVTHMESMFQNAAAFNQDISKWDVSSVSRMGSMFQNALAFNQDLSKWDVSSVTDMNEMFADASAFQYQLCGVDWVNSKASQKDMFRNSQGGISSIGCTKTNTATSSSRSPGNPTRFKPQSVDELKDALEQCRC